MSSTDGGGGDSLGEVPDVVFKKNSVKTCGKDLAVDAEIRETY
jgi:hypothetical protein